jgi:DNA-binding XRE family transcriptional regulator
MLLNSTLYINLASSTYWSNNWGVLQNEYEERAQMFIVSEMLKVARKEANLTQEQLAIKAGTKKSYISKIENAKGNIQLSTLIRIFEKGLNKKIGLTFL